MNEEISLEELRERQLAEEEAEQDNAEQDYLGYNPNRYESFSHSLLDQQEIFEDYPKEDE